MTDQQTATPRAEMGFHMLKIAAVFGAVLIGFSVVHVVFQLNATPMLIVGWFAFIGLTTIGVVNYADGRKNAE